MDKDLRNLMLVVLAIVGLLIYRASHPSATFAVDGNDAAWDEAVKLDRDAGQPAVVLFTADWCPTCRALHADVLSRLDVQQELMEHYFFYTVDLTNPSPQVQAHANEFGVKYIPMLIRFDKNGNETARANYLDADDLIAWLKAGE
ncbi:MAG TPA: thioredoxin family protein [Tepidisphaeraceae bacterium]|nr:thioredoxin family protein [Tepidisphaeraceae bacterium]